MGGLQKQVRSRPGEEPGSFSLGGPSQLDGQGAGWGWGEPPTLSSWVTNRHEVGLHPFPPPGAEGRAWGRGPAQLSSSK